ncbi:hypothetical protein BRADI_4g21933v3 [Brachypodium distachyon]|uniref:FBD domain-containing protein n=1 Tax=Brachypodium distachyon TaxID=15368 RepID=A0A2K2CP99_BRADI|nr:hypothetical protein BRADI_4g21933v3 [Brachypodium distachyon]
METLCLDTIIDFMRYFSCLEKLYIEPFGNANNLWYRKHRNVVKYFDIPLKTTALGYYGGNPSYINLPHSLS